MSSNRHLDVLLQVLVLDRKLLCRGQYLLWRLVIVVEWSTRESTLICVLTGNVWEYRAFCSWCPHISIALNLVITLCVSQAQISLPRTYHALPQPFACAHFVLFLLNTSFIETTMQNNWNIDHWGKKRSGGRNRTSLWEIWDNKKWSNVRVIKVPERKTERESRGKEIFEQWWLRILQK